MEKPSINQALSSFTWGDRMELASGTTPFYQLAASRLYLAPTGAAAGSYTLGYTACWTNLTGSADVLPRGYETNNYESAIVFGAAAKALLAIGREWQAHEASKLWTAAGKRGNLVESAGDRQIAAPLDRREFACDERLT